MREAKLVIMDEPTAALGVTQTRVVLDLIHRLKSQDIAVIVISHNLNDVVRRWPTGWRCCAWAGWSPSGPCREFDTAVHRGPDDHGHLEAPGRPSRPTQSSGSSSEH